jgi:hypothetical protein
MAREMDEPDLAARLHRIFESGRRRTLEKLWNGEYFIQDVDLRQYPRDQYGPGCLADQLFGQGWAHQVGLGHLYPPEHVRQALQAIWKYNWAPDIGPHNAAHPPERWFVSPGEAGLFTCTWPHSPHLAEGVRYRDEVWTGIEYQVAGHMIWEGLVEPALVMLRAVHERYDSLRHNPYNEVECGDHYARALASWGVYLALCGYEYHGPRGELGFAPKLSPEDFRCAFTAAEGWGTFSQQCAAAGQRCQVALRWGRLRLTALRLAVPEALAAAPVQATAGGREVELRSTPEPGHLRLRFADVVVLNTGDTLEVTIGT